MTDKVAICNMALSDVGAKNLIASITEKSNEAKYCNTYYDTALNAALEANDWGFASRVVTLAEAGTPPTNWAHQYAWPNNTLVLREIVQASRRSQKIPYSVYSDDTLSKRYIATDIPQASMRVTSRISNVAMFPPLFVEAFHFKLAMLIAMPITRKRIIREDMQKLYLQSINEAAVSSLNQKGQDEPGEVSWIEARG